MGLRRTVRRLRARWDVIWAKPTTRLTFVIVGTIMGVSAHFYPVIKKIITPPADLTKEQISYYDKDNYYPIQVRKQREQAKQELRQQNEENLKS